MRSGVHCPAPCMAGNSSGKGAASIFIASIGNFHAGRNRPAPQIDPRVAVRLDGQNRHALARPHRRRIEQELLAEWKRLRCSTRAADQQQTNRGQSAAQ